MAEGFEAIFPMIIAHARRTDPAKGQIFHRNMENHIIDRYAAGDSPIKHPAFFAAIITKIIKAERTITSVHIVDGGINRGDFLDVKKVTSVDAAIDYVNGRDRPLGLYYFGDDSSEERRVLDRTIPGGVTVNDVIFHVAMENLPFGGVGPSGMGNYHGEDGFKTFSHAKAVFKQTGVNVAKLSGMKPPYGPTTKKTIAQTFKK